MNQKPQQTPLMLDHARFLVDNVHFSLAVNDLDQSSENYQPNLLFSLLEIIIWIKRERGFYPRVLVLEHTINYRSQIMRRSENVFRDFRREVKRKIEACVKFIKTFSSNFEGLEELESQIANQMNRTGEKGESDNDIFCEKILYHLINKMDSMLVQITRHTQALLINLEITKRHEDLEEFDLNPDSILHGECDSDDIKKLRVLQTQISYNHNVTFLNVESSQTETTEEKPLEGNWSKPMSKAEIMTRLKMGQKKFDTFSKAVGLKKFGRQQWSICLDRCTPEQRHLIEHGRPKT